MTEEELLKFGGGFLDTVQRFKTKQTALIAAGDALARALGHKLGCPKISPAVPCTCGEGTKQSQALSDWAHVTRNLEWFAREKS